MARTARIGSVTREQVVLAFWHEYNLSMYAIAAARRGDLPHASFTTDTARGTVIQTIFESIAHRPGQVVVLRLPGADEAATGRAVARRLGELGSSEYSVVVTPDGPWGPYRVAKPGVLIVARHAGLPILPVAVRARPAIRLHGRWDHQLFPLPFSRLDLVAGEPITMAAEGRLRPLLPRVQAALDAVAARASAPDEVTKAAEGRLP